MADVNVTLTDLVINTRSADLVAGGASITTGQTFSIAVTGRTEGILLVLEEQGGGATVVTFDAGDDPPSKREGMGLLAISLATSDLRLLILEGGRFIQNTAGNPITGFNTGNTIKMLAYRLSRKW